MLCIFSIPLRLRHTLNSWSYRTLGLDHGLPLTLDHNITSLEKFRFCSELSLYWPGKSENKNSFTKYVAYSSGQTCHCLRSLKNKLKLEKLLVFKCICLIYNHHMTKRENEIETFNLSQKIGGLNYSKFK